MRIKRQEGAAPDFMKWQVAAQKNVDRFIRKMRGAEKAEAKELVQSYCSSLYDSAHVATSSLQSQLAQAQRNKEVADAHKKNIGDMLLHTPKRLDAPPSEHSQGLMSGGLSRMRVSDAIQLVLYGALTILSMVVSFENLRANLLGTAMQIFIDDPSKVTWLSLLAPAAGMAIKNLPAMFGRDASRALCKRVIIAITGVSALAWVALFSASFDGLSGHLPDFSDFSLEGSSKGNWLTFTQLFTEIMISASLFLRFGDILSIYEPENKIDNSEHDKLHADLAQAEVAAIAAENAFTKVNNALAQHEAARKAFVSDALGQLAMAQKQFNDLHTS